MGTEQILLIVAGIGLLAGVAVGAWLLLQQRRREAYRHRFGPEYDRAVSEAGDRSAAEHELDRRAERVAQLDLHPLSRHARDRYAASWTALQEDFVDDPSGAISRADQLVSEVLEARGYPAEDFEQRTRDLSVEHNRVIASYRTAHDIAVRHAESGVSTEELRRALVSYRELFDDLLDTGRTQGNDEEQPEMAAAGRGEGRR